MTVTKANGATQGANTQGAATAQASVVVSYQERYAIMKKPATLETLIAEASDYFSIDKNTKLEVYIRTPAVFQLQVTKVQLHQSYYPSVADGDVIFLVDPDKFDYAAYALGAPVYPV